MKLVKSLPLPVLAVVGVLLLVALAFGGAQLGLPIPLLAKGPSSAPADAKLPRYQLKERVINLVPDGRQKVYVKIVIAFDYTGPGVPNLSKIEPAERLKVSAESNKKLDYEVPALANAMTEVVGSKHQEDILTEPGKVKLAQELLDRFNDVLAPEFTVVRVLLVESVVQ